MGEGAKGKQPLEEDDNGPMALELLAVPDGQLVPAVGPLFFRYVHGGRPGLAAQARDGAQPGAGTCVVDRVQNARLGRGA